MHDLMGDVRIAARRLRHSPGFVLVAVLSLTMAIAANLVVFGVMNAAILRPLNVAGATGCGPSSTRSTGTSATPIPTSGHAREEHDLQRYGGVPHRRSRRELGGAAKKSWMYEVSGSYFDMLGVEPQVGRLFHSSDEHGPNSAP